MDESARSSCRPACAPRTVKLPEIAELQVLRHFNRLSQMNFSVESGTYPLGSCTMKYNPKVSEYIAVLSGDEGGPPAPAGGDHPGSPRDILRPLRDALRDNGDEGFLAQPSGRSAGRVRRGPHDAEVPPRPGASGEGRDPRPRLGARHQPGERSDGRVQGRQGAIRRDEGSSAWSRWRKLVSGQDGRDDAYRAEHARASSRATSARSRR